MSLLSGVNVVDDESEVVECLSSSAQPTSEARAKAARQVRINVEGRMEVLVMFINVRIRQEPTPPMGCTPHDVSRVFRCKHQTVKTSSKKKSLRVGKFIASVYGVYFPGHHGPFGTDADHVPVIPGNDFAPEFGNAEGYQLQDSASGNMEPGQSSIGD